MEALKAEMGMPELTLNTETGLPLICDYYAATNLVTTTPELADPVSKRDEEYYSKVGKNFVYVGPLLDVAGAKRAGGMLHAGGSEADSSPPDTEVLMARVAEAAESGASLVQSQTVTQLTLLLLGYDRRAHDRLRVPGHCRHLGR